MSASRIPKKIADFNSYISDTDNHLQVINPGPPPVPNWQRLGLTQQDADQWHAIRQVWGALYPQYTNPDTHTKTVTDEVEETIEAFRVFAQPLLNIMAPNPNATAQDANILNFKIGRSEPTHPTVPIAEVCLVKTESMGQGLTRFIVRTDEDRRPAMAGGANIIQVAIKIGGTPPTGPEDGTSMFILGKAIDTYNLGSQNVGQRAYAYFRYVNTRYPHLAGGYSEAVTFLIS